MTVDITERLFADAPTVLGRGREAKAAGQTAPVAGFAGAAAVVIQLEVSKGSGNGSVTVLAEQSSDAGVSWSTLIAFDAITDDALVSAKADTPSDLLRVRWTVTGSNPTFLVDAQARVVPDGSQAAANVAAIADPSTATAEDASNTINDVIAALIAAGLMEAS